MSRFPARLPFSIPLAGGATLPLGDRCLVMGIVNVTPDSFAGARGGVDADAAIAAALQMEADGADLVDVGGESTRPGAEPVPEDEELVRVLPVVRGLAGRLRIPISIDTYKVAVGRAAIEAGASL